MSGLFDDRPLCSGSYYGPIAPLNTSTYPATFHTPPGEFDQYEYYRQQFEALGVYGQSEDLSYKAKDDLDEEYEDDETIYDEGDSDEQPLNEYGKRPMLSPRSSKRSRLNENGDICEIAPVLTPKQNEGTPIEQSSISQIPLPRLIKVLPKRNGVVPSPPPPDSPLPRLYTPTLTRTQVKVQESIRLLMRKSAVSLTSRPNAVENVQKFLSTLKSLPSEKTPDGECASRMSRLERYRWLCEEEWATNVNRTYVNCVGCGRKVQLDKRADAEWYLSLWVKHRNKCHKMYEKWQRMQDLIGKQIEKENEQKELVIG